MAGSSLLALIDDIATTLDDVAVMTKVAAKKTAGVLGDDLALNAEQVAGVNADRELPVVWAVAKGSAINKLILVPVALAISFFIPTLITPLLMLGGLFLCYEGFEKVYEKLFHKDDEAAIPESDKLVFIEDRVAYEKDKIKGAIRTDFVLSAEIVVITLGTVSTEVLSKQVAVLFGISAIMTIGVYGLVALIVKLDDIGFYLIKNKNQSIKVFVGKILLSFAPKLMKALGLIGTVAMFLVGGGIITHAIHWLHQLEQNNPGIIAHSLGLVVGLIAGGICFLVHVLFLKIKSKLIRT